MISIIPTKADLIFYDIKRFGLYDSWNNPPKCLNAKETLVQLQTWGVSTGKPLVETSTYEASGKLLRSYLWDLVEDQTTGTWLLALWNEVENKKGKVAVVSGNNKVGHADVSETGAKKGDIPGFMTLFWILPKKNLIVSVKIGDQTSLGIDQLRAYLIGFSSAFSEQIIRTNPKDKTHTAYTDQKKDPSSDEDKRVPNSKLNLSIQIVPTRYTGEIDFIKRNAHSVTKLIRKIKVETGNTKSFWNSVADNLSDLFNNSIPNEKRFVKVEYPTNIGKDDVSQYEKDYVAHDMSEAYDMTFVFKGNKIPNHCLSGMRAIENISGLNVPYKSDNTPDLAKLLTTLNTSWIEEVDNAVTKRK